MPVSPLALSFLRGPSSSGIVSSAKSKRSSSISDLAWPHAGLNRVPAMAVRLVVDRGRRPGPPLAKPGLRAVRRAAKGLPERLPRQVGPIAKIM